MFTVFQGETGGYKSIPFESIPAVSGYAFAVSQERITYRFDGIVESGVLYIAKSGIGNLPPGQYIFMPQLLDDDNSTYFLEIEDLRILEVPDFFSSAVLFSGDSLLTRLETLESISSGYVEFIAATPIQTDRAVALTASGIVHADCRNIQHAGLVVGIATESGGVGDTVKVQQVGMYENKITSFPGIGAAIVGENGSLGVTVPNSALFVQFIGTIIDTDRIIIDVDNSVILT